jgi:ABC-type lipoprotein export system ATPase subunit
VGDVAEPHIRASTGAALSSFARRRWQPSLQAPLPEPVAGTHEAPSSAVTLLTLSSVSQSYWRGPSERPVLRGVSLEVRAGELVAVYGQRGAGKTTLLKIAAGFDRPDAGQVLFEGVDLASLSRRELAAVHRERIGWVERNGPHSRELPTGVYVALPLYGKVGPTAAQRLAVAALSRVGAADCAERAWDELSDADRVLAAIAHALVREPCLLVVDDPTAGLGIFDRERVVGLLRSAAEDAGIGVLMAAPDMPAMLHAHEVRSLSRGRLMAPASRDEGKGRVVALPARDLGA